MSSLVKMVSKDKLAEMHTGTLMARRDALLKCEESLGLSDRDENHSVAVGTIEFKDTDEWKLSYRQLKEELSTRENLPSKGERKEDRKLNAS
jgi:hypothetical protein